MAGQLRSLKLRLLINYQKFCCMKILFSGAGACLLFAGIVLTQGCSKKFIDQQLKDFEQVNLIANNSDYGAGRS
jgi:hypothetical protein